MNVIPLLPVTLPLLKRNFTKNYCVNSVTTGAAGVFLILAAISVEQAATIDQAITLFSNYGPVGV